MNFGQAMVAIISGQKVTRAAWSGTGRYVFNRAVNDTQVVSLRSLAAIETADGTTGHQERFDDYIKAMGQGDAQADDWEVLNEPD